MESELKIVALNRADEVRRARAEVESFGQRLGVPEPVLLVVDLALEEWLSNILKYAHTDTLQHDILIRFQITERGIRLVVEDDGQPFNPLNQPPPDISAPLEERTPGGLGILMIRKFMDRVEYAHSGGRNILTLTKYVDFEPPPPRSRPEIRFIRPGVLHCDLPFPVGESPHDVVVASMSQRRHRYTFPRTQQMSPGG